MVKTKTCRLWSWSWSRSWSWPRFGALGPEGHLWALGSWALWPQGPIGPGAPWAHLLTIFYLTAFYLLTFVVNKLPIAIVYATWSGLGIFTIAILGYIFFKQTLAWQAILGLFLIVVGVILVNTFTVKLN